MCANRWQNCFSKISKNIYFQYYLFYTIQLDTKYASISSHLFGRHLVSVLDGSLAVNYILTLCTCNKLHVIRIFIHKTVNHINLLQSQLH